MATLRLTLSNILQTLSEVDARLGSFHISMAIEANTVTLLAPGMKLEDDLADQATWWGLARAAQDSFEEGNWYFVPVYVGAGMVKLQFRYPSENLMALAGALLLGASGDDEAPATLLWETEVQIQGWDISFTLPRRVQNYFWVVEVVGSMIANAPVEPHGIDEALDLIKMEKVNGRWVVTLQVHPAKMSEAFALEITAPNSEEFLDLEEGEVTSISGSTFQRMFGPDAFLMVYEQKETVPLFIIHQGGKAYHFWFEESPENLYGNQLQRVE